MNDTRSGDAPQNPTDASQPLPSDKKLTKRERRSKSRQAGPKLRLGLALSGGGFRAMIFHLEVLKYLAATGLLSQVKVITSVSGGSLVGAGVTGDPPV